MQEELMLDDAADALVVAALVKFQRPIGVIAQQHKSRLKVAGRVVTLYAEEAVACRSGLEAIERHALELGLGLS